MNFQLSFGRRTWRALYCTWCARCWWLLPSMRASSPAVSICSSAAASPHNPWWPGSSWKSLSSGSISPRRFSTDGWVFQTLRKQECIPVGCIPSASVAASYLPGGVSTSREWVCLVGEGCLPGAGVLPGGGGVCLVGDLSGGGCLPKGLSAPGCT